MSERELEIAEAVNRQVRQAGLSGADAIELFDQMGGRRFTNPKESDSRPAVQPASVKPLPTEKV